MRFLFEAYKNIEPMIELFTPDGLSPSEKTLEIIRQIAYTYRTLKVNGKQEFYSLN